MNSYQSEEFRLTVGKTQVTILHFRALPGDTRMSAQQTTSFHPHTEVRCQFGLRVGF